jgi:nicotinamidase-related amidase
VVPSVHAALMAWETDRFNRIRFVPKGSNYMTEHYSAVMADVIDDTDVTTKLNTDLIDVLKTADEILITGEALSHCVASTVTDVANNFGEDNVKKFTLLQDTTSNVGGFEKLGRDFVINMAKRGMKLTTTKDW